MSLRIMFNRTTCLVENRTVSNSGGGTTGCCIENLDAGNIISLNSYSYIPNEAYKISGDLRLIRLA